MATPSETTQASAADQPQRPLAPGLPRRAGREYGWVLLAAAVLYVITVAPGPLWQDSGLIQIRVLLRDLHGHFGLALSHPLYYCIAIAFQGLPLAESAYKTNLVSAVFGAVTVANLFLLLRVLGCAGP
jgi:isoprenylcysteine carboxyl methyltransferase (ICMT) family protein YpbQ